MIVSIFSFAYVMAETWNIFPTQKIVEEQNKKSFLSWYWNLIKKPLLGYVSAQSPTTGLGCCSEAVNGDLCAITDAAHCKEGALFSLDSVCSAAPSCQKGCCYDSSKGIFERNVLKSRCRMSWVAQPSCDLPQATKGCCVLGSLAQFETKGECKVHTETIKGKKAVVDWRSEIGEAACSLLTYAGDEGACILQEENCVILPERDCLNAGGVFSKGYLCTSKLLKTACEKTTETKCVEGKDGVYFLDSCGNIANVYDAARASDQSYWEKMIEPHNSCGTGDSKGNANSLACGNCNRFMGGICKPANSSSVTPTYGTNACAVTSCEFKGKKYKNGESWCDYDGKIGDGDDVPGSRHFRYVCNQGRVDTEPCGDYRNQICIVSDKVKFENTEIDFSQSACVNNNWRECVTIDMRTEDGPEKCADALNCFVNKINIADNFNFPACTPKYPGGFDVKEQRYQATSQDLCSSASMNCTVYYSAKFFGGCKVAANEGCLGEQFGEQMNEFCRTRGDCGAEANIAGQLTKNMKIRGETPGLSESYLSKLRALARYIPGQKAEPEDYSEYLMSLGVIGGAGDDGYRGWQAVAGFGLAGVLVPVVASTGLFGAVGTFSMEAAIAAANTASVASGGSATAFSAAAAFASVAIGAIAGAVAGYYFAQKAGLSPFGTILMSSGGAMVGAVIGYMLYMGVLFTLPGVGWIIAAIGVILIAISFLFKSDCDPKVVQFECKVWQAPRGGGDCEKCNDDPLKPCSKYRCESLGQRCEFVDQEDNGWDRCVDADPNDVSPPTIAPLTEVIGEGLKYNNIEDNSFSIEQTSGGCVPANTPLLFGIKTNEMALCKFDAVDKNFEEMSFDFGGNLYMINHTTMFPLPDPTHGQSMGSNWTGDVKLYVNCEDRGGLITPVTHQISLCVAQGPDITPPVIRAMEPKSGTKVGYNQTSKAIRVITNELSTCRWSTNEVSYSSMEGNMSCNDELYAPSSVYGFVCTTSLPTPQTTNDIYISCKDQPWLTGEEETKRSANEPMKFSLTKPASPIRVDSVEPRGKIVVGTDWTTVNTTIMTSGGGDVHICSYSLSGYQTMFPILGVGNERTFTIPINMGTGVKKIYVRCEDETGDKATGETEVEIIKDDKVPEISRLWKLGSSLTFITSESSECRYSKDLCGFSWNGSLGAGTGFSHQIEILKGTTYYLKCMDGYGNVPETCTLTVST